MSVMPSATSSAQGRPWLAAFTLMAAVAAILGTLLADPVLVDGWRMLHWACKPLATALILRLVWSAQPALSTCYRQRISAGIVCSLLGDVLLMLPQDRFVPDLFVCGLVAFLCGHLCFLAAFLGDSRFAVRPLWLLASWGYGAINLWLLWDSIGASLRLPVIIYVVVLSSMGGQALARARMFVRRSDAQAGSARRAAVGAVLFMLSDSLLAWNRFHAAIPLSSLWVLSTYYLALWWIARSVQRDDILVEAGAVL